MVNFWLLAKKHKTTRIKTPPKDITTLCLLTQAGVWLAQVLALVSYSEYVSQVLHHTEEIVDAGSYGGMISYIITSFGD